ncbi:MAG: SRPBCC family protein [Acidimicrobiales bacterium]
MTINATTSRTINAPQEVVWAILDDFPRISAWSAGIKNSYTTGDDAKETGVGAERRCELGGKKILDERIAAYTPGESMTIHVWNVEGLPLKSTKASFSLRSTGNGTTEATINAEVEPKIPGFMQAIMRPVLSKGIAKNFSGLLDELAAEAEARVTV